MNQIQQQTPAQASPFDGITGAVAATTIDQADHLKIAVMGPPKNGKSWFAATLPGTSLIYDFDDRKVSLGGLPQELRSRIVAKTLRDTLDIPTVVTALETDISNFKYRKIQGLPIPDNYVFDTVSNLISNGIKHEYLKNNPKDGRSFRLGGTKVQIGISFDLINVTKRFLEYILTEYSSLGNVIFVFHERDEKDVAESKPNETKYTGQVTIDPQFASNILTLFNEVFRIRVGGDGKYTVYTKPSYEVTASTTLLVDAVELPNLAAMIEKHRQRKLELK